MRKFIYIFLALFLLVPSVTLAATFKAEQNNAATNIESTETVKNAYLAGNSVNFSGKSLQDAIIAGNSLNITGNIGSSLMMAGNNITVSAPVGQSIRVVGANINLQNTIGSDVLAAGSAIILGSGATVADDFLCAGATADLMGNVGGDVKISAGQININSQINGNVIIKGSGKVTIGDKAVIGGNLNYEAAEPATIAPGAKIAGETNFTKAINKDSSAKAPIGKFAGLITMFSLGVLGVTFLTIWFLVYLMPKLTRNLVENALAKPAENMGLGFVYLVVVPIAAIVLLCTLIGAPLGLLVFGFYGVVMAIAKLVVPVLAGSLLFKWFGKSKVYRIDWLTILVGIVVVAIVGAIPFFGGLAVFLLYLMAFAQIAKSVVDFIKAQK